MAELNLLKVNWNNDAIKDAYNISDEALNSDNFYYITSEGKLAFIEKKANNSAEKIAKVFYTLGLLDENRVAKDKIACGIICNKKHVERVKATETDDYDDDFDDDSDDSEEKREEINKVKNGIAAAMLSVNDQIDAITKEVMRINDMVIKLRDLVD